MRAVTRLSIVAVTIALAGGTACGSSGSSAKPATTTSTSSTTTTTTATTTTTTTVPSGPVDVSSGRLPNTPLTAPFNVASAGPSAEFDESTFGIAPDSLTMAWYIVGDTWAVHFVGLDDQHAIGKCPGAFLNAQTSFDDVSHSPYGADACKGFARTILPPGSLHLCGDVAIVYTTTIPRAAEGDLVALLEQGLDSGVIQTMQGHALADATQAPEIDVSGCRVIS